MPSNIRKELNALDYNVLHARRSSSYNVAIQPWIDMLAALTAAAIARCPLPPFYAGALITSTNIVAGKMNTLPLPSQASAGSVLVTTTAAII